jgi:protein-tyrosine-phosphatase
MPPGAHDRLASVEDHVVVETDEAANHLIKFADYGQFMNVFVIPPPPPPPPRDQAYPLGRLTVVVMPYADLASCKQLDELSSRAATPHLRGRYLRIEIANRDLLLRKLRATAAVDDEASRVRDLATQIESLGRGLFPANKYPRTSAHALRQNRQIAMERLMKAHLDAKQYGDAHDLLLLLDKRKHDAVFTFYDPCRGHGGDDSPEDLAGKKQGVARRLEEYRQELERRHGNAPLEQWPERAVVLHTEARRKFDREIVDARRQVIDIVETAVQQLESIAEQLLAAGTEPSLLGCD